MESLVLESKNLGSFLDACAGHRRVHVPVEDSEDHYRFAPWAEVGAEGLALQALRTALPPKKFFFPPEELLFECDGERYQAAPSGAEDLLLFGLHPCDLHGLAITDHFFERDHPDPSYRERRRRALLIGLGCIPDERCFCSSLGTQHIDGHYDLFFWELGERFYVMVRTEAGHDLVHLARHCFRDVSSQDQQDYLALLQHRKQAFTLELDVSDLPQVLETQTDAPVWQELGAACFACGACSMVCPTCTCYDIFDRVLLDGSSQRCRRWDSCLFRDFDRVAGEHHFREGRGDRVRNRYYHKEHGYVNGFGLPSCTGCGRCIQACPAGIDVVSVFARVRQACTPNESGAP